MAPAPRHRLLVAVAPGELWAARLVTDRLVDLRVERSLRPSRLGEVALGRVLGLLPALPAALVDLGEERPAFLGAEDGLPGTGLAGLTEGQAVLVQRIREPRGGKAAGVSLRLGLAGRALTLVPWRPGLTAAPELPPDERQRLLALLAPLIRPEEGIVIGAAAAGAGAEALAAELARLRRRWAAITAQRAAARPPARLEPAPGALGRLLGELTLPLVPSGAPAQASDRAPEPTLPDAIILDDRAAFAEARGWFLRHAPELAPRLAVDPGAAPLFERHGVAEAVAEALAPRVALPGGGALAIEATSAALMIDVDSGPLAGRRDPAAALLATNLAAAEAAARQIRLRGLGGAIVIDFVSMRRRDHRARVLAALTQALGEDPVPSQILGWTRLGHVELTRKRLRPSLAELLCEPRPGGALVRTPLTVALEGLRAALREAAATPGRVLALRLDPLAAAVLAGEGEPALRLAEERLGRALAVIAEPGRDRETFDIGPADDHL